MSWGLGASAISHAPTSEERRRRNVVSGRRGRRLRRRSIGIWPPPTRRRRCRGDLVALIAPHAGLMYSGPVAAHAYRLLRDRAFDVAVLVGPSHFLGFDGVSLYPSGGFRDAVRRRADRRRLRRARSPQRSSIVHDLPAAHAREHSLEMQLPFLVRLAPGAADRPAADGLSDRGDRGGAGRRARRRAGRPPGAADRQHRSLALSRRRAPPCALDRVVIDCVRTLRRRTRLQAALEATAGARLRRRADGRRRCAPLAPPGARDARSSTTPTPATSPATSRRWSAISPRRWARSNRRQVDAGDVERTGASLTTEHDRQLLLANRARHATLRLSVHARPTYPATPASSRSPVERSSPSTRAATSAAASATSRPTEPLGQSCRAARSLPAAAIRGFRPFAPSELARDRHRDLRCSVRSEPIAGPQDIVVGPRRPRRRARVAAWPSAAAGRAPSGSGMPTRFSLTPARRRACLPTRGRRARSCGDSRRKSSERR